ncbi:hypothetical protein C8J56DRAFT_886428 [Mycena floridula]|nr:hypothetical protein C8J56DRAFT_886428 [Mycena floridula]
MKLLLFFPLIFLCSLQLAFCVPQSSTDETSQGIEVRALCALPVLGPLLGISGCIDLMIETTKKGIKIIGLGNHNISGYVLENGVGILELSPDDGVKLCLSQFYDIPILGPFWYAIGPCPPVTGPAP